MYIFIPSIFRLKELVNYLSKSNTDPHRKSNELTRGLVSSFLYLIMVYYLILYLIMANTPNRAICLGISSFDIVQFAV